MTNDFLVVIFISSLPFFELRLALPLALTVYDVAPLSAYVASVIGNIIPVVVILMVLPACVRRARKSIKILDKFFTWWFLRVAETYERKINKWGALALIIFVAIPLPMTGAWTGTVAAYIFNIPRTKAFIYISFGVIISGIVILFSTLGIVKLFS